MEGTINLKTLEIPAVGFADSFVENLYNRYLLVFAENRYFQIMLKCRELSMQTRALVNRTGNSNREITKFESDSQDVLT